MKLRLFEFEDQSWLPANIRQGMTDYLRFIFNTANLYGPAAPLIAEACHKSGSGHIVDLCSGSGGCVQKIQKNIKHYHGREINFILTDKFPNLPAYKFIHKKTNGRISFVEEPVDATMVSSHIKGFRTIFSGFHHFSEKDAVSALKNAVNANEGIAVFDGGDKNLKILLAIMIGHPLIFFFCTPFFKPFSLSRLLFTYLIPILPLCTIWDGLVSVLRLYKPAELKRLGTIAGENYTWKSGKVKNAYGMNIAYLIGLPPKKK